MKPSISSPAIFPLTAPTRFGRWLASKFSGERGRPSSFRASLVEPLESRIAPATFTGAGTVLTIDLNTANELVTFSTSGTIITAALTGGTATDGGGTGGNVSGFTTSTALITSAGFTSIIVTDSSTGDAVAFANSTGPYAQAFSITE